MLESLGLTVEPMLESLGLMLESRGLMLERLSPHPASLPSCRRQEEHFDLHYYWIKKMMNPKRRMRKNPKKQPLKQQKQLMMKLLQQPQMKLRS